MTSSRWSRTTKGRTTNWCLATLGMVRMGPMVQIGLRCQERTIHANLPDDTYVESILFNDDSFLYQKFLSIIEHVRSTEKQ